MPVDGSLPRRDGLGLVGRWAIAAVASVVAVGNLTAWSAAYRAVEARVAAIVVSTITPARVHHDAWRVANGRRAVWFVVTNACTSSVLLVPIAVIAAWCLVVPTVRARSALVGAATGAIVMVGVNTLRLAGVALAWWRWGTSSLLVTHDVLGTVMSIGAAAVGITMQLRITSRPR